LQVEKSGRWYTSPGIDWPAAQDFARAFSKGFWYWSEWMGHRDAGTVALEPGDMLGTTFTRP
jgi:hypothetical protein